MKLLDVTMTLFVVGIGIDLFAVFALASEPSFHSGDKSNEIQAAESPPKIVNARAQAELMHKIYASTLDVMHQHYFHENKSTLPARAMEDIFADLNSQLKIKSKWISVNTSAMSVHHEPKSDFELKAAVELRAGKAAYEAVESGYLYRASPIALGAGCVSCHTGFFSKPATTPRLAGLIIGIPLVEE